MRFAIYYGDGSRVSGASESDWTRAPATDVIAIMVYSDILVRGAIRYREIHANAEYYWYDPRADVFGRSVGWDATADPPPAGVIWKRAPAALLPRGQYEAIIDRSFSDRTF